MEEEDGGLFYLDSPSYFYSTTKYWDNRYEKSMNPTANKKEDKTIYEWFMSLEVVMKNEIISTIIKKLKTEQENRPVKILDIGCGNSELPVDLVRFGFEDVLAVDFSKIVVDNMSNKFKEFNPKLKFLEMDVTDLKFNNETFDLVIDKGCMDALVFTENPSKTTLDMQKEITRVLKPGAHYLQITSFGHESRVKYLINREVPWEFEHSTVFNKSYHMFYINSMKKRGPYSDTEWAELEEKKKKLIELDDTD